MSAKRQLETRKIELVETHNIALSIERLRNAGSYDDGKWRRALYHVLGMSVSHHNLLEKIRIALELP